MIKTLKNLFKQDKERFLIPNGVQDVIPIRKIYDDGVFQVGDDKFSKTYKFTDINYAVASREDKETMFLEYSELLNSFDSGATTKITINNRRLNRVDFEKNILIPLTGDALDEYRKEYNSMLLEKAIDAKSTIKDAEQTTETTRKTIAASSRVSKGVTQVAKSVTRTITSGAKTVAKATTKAVRATMTTAKMSVAAIAAGGWVAVVAIVVICLSALLLGSVFGIFFAGEDTGTGQTIQTVVREINSDYDDKLMSIRDKSSYDVLEMKGSRAVWKEVLAVYSVKVNTDPDNPQEVVTMDDAKKKLLKTIFWDMNNISSRTEDKLETVITETDDGNGNIVQIKNTERRTYLYITVSHKTAYDMASKYGFNREQREYLDELLSDENNSLWSSVLYGTSGEDNQIVAVALSQVGNVGGRPYWSWYGFNSRVEWCACFVSWCANECGYIETGIIPKYASCVNGVQWFKDRGQWLDGSAEPLPGMIIFYDWDKQGQSGQQDGRADHTGIVWKVENGYVYTIEGNLSDKCTTSHRPIGEYQILGYGVPEY